MGLKGTLPKWTLLSIMKHFTDSITLHTFVEGTERRTEAQTDYCEIRLDGPDMAEGSKGTFVSNCTVQTLVVTKIDLTNPTKHIENIQQVNEAFANCILLYNGTTEVGMLQLNNKEGINIENLGQIDQSLDILQANIVGDYKVIINE